MANEIAAVFEASKTVYFQVFSRTGTVWNTSSSSFVTYSSSDIADYDVAMTEQGTASGIYEGTFPSAITAGVYQIIARNQVGGAVAQTDPVVATGDYQWNGTVTLPLSDLATSGQVGQTAPIRMAKGVAISGFPVYLVSAADHVTPFTSGVVSGQISRNGGSFGAFQSGTLTEVGLGFYRINVTSGDVNADTVSLWFQGVGISGGTSDPRTMSIVLQRVSGSNP